MESQMVEGNFNLPDIDRSRNVETEFLCEAFSLIDAVNQTNLMYCFATHVEQHSQDDCLLEWHRIPDLYSDGIPKSYLDAVRQVGEAISQVIGKGWVTPLRIQTLGTKAYEVYRYHRNEKERKRKYSHTFTHAENQLTQEDAWLELSMRLKELGDFLQKNKSYHSHFQERNYRPHPDSWKVYAGTILSVCVALLY